MDSQQLALFKKVSTLIGKNILIELPTKEALTPQNEYLASEHFDKGLSTFVVTPIINIEIIKYTGETSVELRLYINAKSWEFSPLMQWLDFIVLSSKHTNQSKLIDQLLAGETQKLAFFSDKEGFEHLFDCTII